MNKSTDWRGNGRARFTSAIVNMFSLTLLTTVSATAELGDNTELFSTSRVHAQHGLDIDSMEGFICKAEHRAIDVEGSVYCVDGLGSVALPALGVSHADRIAVDHGGRIWFIRWNDAGNPAEPGLFLQIDDEAVKMGNLPELESNDRIDSMTMTGVPSMWSIADRPEIPLRTLMVITESGRVFAYTLWSEGAKVIYANGQYENTGLLATTEPGWSEIFPPQNDALPGDEIRWVSTAITHTKAANNSFAWVLSNKGIPHMLTSHEQWIFEGEPFFPIFTFPSAQLPLTERALGTQLMRSDSGSFLGTRFLWSRQYWVSEPQDFWSTPD